MFTTSKILLFCFLFLLQIYIDKIQVNTRARNKRTKKSERERKEKKMKRANEMKDMDWNCVKEGWTCFFVVGCVVVVLSNITATSCTCCCCCCYILFIPDRAKWAAAITVVPFCTYNIIDICSRGYICSTYYCFVLLSL